MTYSTIYYLDGHVAADGVQSQRVCDATVQTARRIAADRGRSVIVEACDRFWSRSDLPTDAALAAAGIRRTAGREQLAIPVMALGMARMLRSRRLARRYPGAGEDDQQAGDGEVAV